MMNNPITNPLGHLRTGSNSSIPPQNIIKSKSNFLYQTIIPHIYNVENIKIIQQYQKKQSQNNSKSKVIQMKKNQINKKIQNIVKKNYQNLQNNDNKMSKRQIYKNFNTGGNKYLKQSKFKQINNYKQDILKNQLTIDKMKLFNKNQNNVQNQEEILYNRTNSQSFINLRTPSNNKIEFQQQQQQPQKAFFIQFDQQLGEKQKMAEQVFEPLKQKVKKVIEKSISYGKNKNINDILKKVNFYLTQVAQKQKNKKHYEKVMINTDKQDRNLGYLANYSQMVQKGVVFTKQLSKTHRVSKSCLVQKNLEKEKSQSFLRSRPQTSSVLSNANRTHSTRLLSSKSCRYSPSSSFQHNVHKKYLNQEQKQKFTNFLQLIENTSLQLSLNKNMISKKIKKMSQQWSQIKNGKKIIQNEIVLPANRETLQLIKQKRKKQWEKQLVDEFLHQ